MPEARKKLLTISGSVGGLALVVGLAANLTTIASFIKGNPETSEPHLEQSPPRPPDTGTDSQPVSDQTPPRDLAEDAEPQIVTPPPLHTATHAVFPLLIRVSKSEPYTARGIGTTVSVSFSNVGQKEITTLHIVPSGGESVTQPVSAPGGSVDFSVDKTHYRATLLTVDRKALEVELVVDRIG